MKRRAWRPGRGPPEEGLRRRAAIFRAVTPYRDWYLAIHVPSDELRNDLALAVADGVAAGKVRHPLAIRSIEAIAGASEPTLYVTARTRLSPAVSEEAVVDQLTSRVRGYGAQAHLDLAAMTVELRPDRPERSDHSDHSDQ
jgi:hypothetical protein